MDRLLPTLIKIAFIRTGHFTCGLSFGLATSPVGCESNGSILLCFSSCRLGKSWCVQDQVNGIPSNIRLAIVSARSDVCGASNSTWSDMFIESTSTPMALSSGMALVPVILLLLAAPTWLWGHCGRHNSRPASSVMDFVFRRSDGSHVSIDTVHPSLLRYSSFSSPRWYHLQSLSSDVFLVSSLYVAKPYQSCFPAPLCYVLYFQFLPDVIVSYMVS